MDKIILSFFILIIATGLINEIFLLNDFSWRPKFATTIKSFLFLKYFLFYLSIRYLIENKIVHLKFFITCTFSSIFVCLDIFIQFFYGTDLFGYKSAANLRKLSGPFGDEYIAGGFIQRFSLFSFFLLLLFIDEKNRTYIKFLFSLLFIIFFLGIILSGNRMPLLLFLLSLSLILIFQKQARKYFISFILVMIITFTLSYNFNEKVKLNFKSFFGQVSKIIVPSANVFGMKDSPQYLEEFSTFYETWRINKYIGGGIKNFRYYCHVRDNIDKNSKFVCNMHPHNYYLEILTETGLLGFGIIFFLFIIILYKVFIKNIFLIQSWIKIII